jgi:hypothetical protein
MILKNDDLLVTLEGTIFRAKQAMKPQFVLDPDALQGFFDGVNTKRTEVTRPNQWGDFREPSLRAARHMSITGAAIAETPGQLMQMRDQFTSLLVHEDFKEMEVQNTSGSRYITVGLEGTPSWVIKGDTVAVWKLDLYAPDPRMYGGVRAVQITDTTISGGLDYPMDYPVSFGGGLNVQVTSMMNSGNTHSWPKFIVTGNYFEGFTVSDSAGHFITYDGIVTMSAPVTIDTGAGTASQNGVDKSSLLSRRDWFSIPPGQSIQPMFLPKQDAAGWCDIIYRDTWI